MLRLYPRSDNNSQMRNALWLAILFSGCSLTTSQPDLSVARGTYTLEQVDGASLPIAVETRECPREIYQGDLQLSAGSIDQRPLYNLLVSLRLRCDPTQLLSIDQRRFVEDFGEWTVDGSNVEFRSSKGFGNFGIPIESGTVLTLRLDGRMYTFRRMTH